MAKGMVDRHADILVDMVKGNAADDLRRRLDGRDPAWMAAITAATTDLAESYRAGLAPHLSHAVHVADPFHVTRVRLEAPCLRGRVRDPPAGLSQQSGEAEGQPVLEVWGRAGSTPDNDGTVPDCQLGQVRLARSKA
jgi:hypothetical protein